MAALVQSYPQQTGTVTMLQTRPTSASAMMTTVSAQTSQSYGSGGSQQRNGVHSGPTVYRAGSAPIQPYAFTSTPSLTTSAQWQQFRSSRALSTPAVPTVQSLDQNQAARSRYPASLSMTNLPSSVSMGMQQAGGSRDDSALPGSGNRRGSSTGRPQSTYLGPSQVATAPIRVSPDRYRRSAQRSSTDPANPSPSQQQSLPGSAPPSGSGMAAVGLYNPRSMPESKGVVPRVQHAALANRPNSLVGLPGAAMDDMQLHRGPSPDDLKRMRRRSMPALDSADFSKPLTPLNSKLPEESTRVELGPPRSADKEQKPARPTPSVSNVAVEKTATNGVRGRTGSSDSQVSSRSAGSSSRPSSSANRSTTTTVSVPASNPAQFSSPVEEGANSEFRLVNIPPRSSSSDAATTKRITNPSPLSKPVTMDAEAEKPAPATAATAAAPAPDSPVEPAASPRIESPAVRQLAAINEKGGKLRSKTSRLRRAFSFGSTAEFKNVVNPETKTGDDSQAPASSSGAAPSKLHKEPTADELYDAEQARIAQLQEAAGIGSSIYSGGRLFSNSTDNLSISSTASSASIMIRKMGRGMKKGTRSLVGLFRPKSVIGVPTADAKLPETSQPTVSMITVEAERERVNVNEDPHAHAGGGTGLPRLERNSIDATKEQGSERLGSSGTDSNSATRKSIVGGEKERAEVLAAVRKGILKTRASGGSSSPSPRSSDTNTRTPGFELPAVPHVLDSPISSAPSTPNDEMQGHRRTGSIAIGSEDYFMSALRLRQNTASAPGTPQGGGARRNATFSPRIVFYDTWPSQEYDRRGEIATCNRLTPMLAQQIKEELNTFKMEMEVHENSKIYTHFF